MGPGGPSGATLTIEESIRLLNPSAVIMVGIAFGVSESKQNIGDILVSKQLIQYDLQRVGTDSNNEQEISLRDDRPSASHRMLQRFRAAAIYWQTPPIVEFGSILSGAKLIDNQDFRDQLLRFAHEAIGGEMEASGLYAVAQRKKVDWIVIKAICDWADGNKHQDKKHRQQLAAENAARFTIHVLEQGGFEKSEQETAEMQPNGIINSNKPKSAEQHLIDLKRRVELVQKRASDQNQQVNNDSTIQAQPQGKERESYIGSFQHRMETFVRQQNEFDLALVKAMPGQGSNAWTYLQAKNKKEIDRVLSSLADACEACGLRWFSGYQWGPACPIRRLAEEVWLIQHDECKIIDLWVYRHPTQERQYVLLHLAPQPPFSLDSGDANSDRDEAGYYKGRYVTREEYDDGYAEIDEKVIEIQGAELRSRNLKDDFKVLAPVYSVYNDRANRQQTVEVDQILRAVGKIDQNLLQPLERLERPEWMGWSD